MARCEKSLWIAEVGCVVGLKKSGGEIFQVFSKDERVEGFIYDKYADALMLKITSQTLLQMTLPKCGSLIVLRNDNKVAFKKRLDHFSKVYSSIEFF